MRRLLLACLIAATGAQARPMEWVTVTRVTDGDTVWVRREGAKPFKVRLQGLDAPERCQPWGTEATQALAGRVLRQRVQLESRALDDYRRVLGNIYLDDGRDVGAWMVAQGHAWSYRSLRSGGPYAREEREARAARRGLFAEASPVEPRDFRRWHGPCER